eukprot:745001_1
MENYTLYCKMLGLEHEHMRIMHKNDGGVCDESMESVAQFLIHSDGYQRLIEILQRHLERFKTKGHSPNFYDIRCVVSRLTNSKTFSRVLARDNQFWEFVRDLMELEFSGCIKPEHYEYYDHMCCDVVGDICAIIFPHAKAVQWEILRKSKFLAVLRKRLLGKHFPGTWVALQVLGSDTRISRVSSDIDRVWLDCSLGIIGGEVLHLIEAFQKMEICETDKTFPPPDVCKTCFDAQSEDTRSNFYEFAVPMFKEEMLNWTKTHNIKDFNFQKKFSELCSKQKDEKRSLIKELLTQYISEDVKGIKYTEKDLLDLHNWSQVKCYSPNCGNVEGKGESFKTCGGCKSVWYCSRECQRHHWKHGHRKVCKSSAKNASNCNKKSMRKK